MVLVIWFQIISFFYKAAVGNWMVFIDLRLLPIENWRKVSYLKCFIRCLSKVFDNTIIMLENKDRVILFHVTFQYRITTFQKKIIYDFQWNINYFFQLKYFWNRYLYKSLSESTLTLKGSCFSCYKKQYEFDEKGHESMKKYSLIIL